MIDAVRITAGVLYTGNFTPPAALSTVTGVAALWQFDGQTANDSSANGNHGTLQGGAGYSIDVAGGSGGSSANVKWLVTDHLGTPRLIFDPYASLASISSHSAVSSALR